jgi:hypothetical protein
MMAGQTIETVITVDAKQAQAEVAKFAGKLSEVEQNANTTSGRLDAMQKSAKGLQEKMGPAAAAISGVASALGQTGGEAAKVVAGVGQMAAAFGAGGPFAVAVVGGTLLLDEYLRVQKETTTNLAVGSAALANYGKTMRDQTTAATIELTAKLREARKEIAEFGKTQGELDVIQAKATVRDTESRLENLDKSIERRKAMTFELIEESRRLGMSGAERDELNRRQRENNDLIAKEEARRAELSVALKTQSDATRGLIQAQSELDKLQAKAAASKKPQAASDKQDADREQIFARTLSEIMDPFGQATMVAADDLTVISHAVTATTDEIERMNAEFLGADDAAMVLSGAIAMTSDEIERMNAEFLDAKETAFDWSGMWSDAVDSVADSFGDLQSVATGALSTLTAGTQQYLDDVITGQENAEAALATMLMRTAGQALIGSGIDLGGRAVVSAFTPGLQPLAAAQGAAAAGLIASGVALGGTATGIEHMAAGGQIGRPLPDKKSATDRGASPRSSRGGGDGGPLVINISYGVGGPLPEDTAREIARVQRTGNRRSGA